jgi:DNA-binding NtrC family response regulator
VNAGSFRLDLYYRLAVVVSKLPALREHTVDIPVLVEHFLHAAGHDGPVSSVIPQQAMESLALYQWPGNVRELRNLVEASLAMGKAMALPDEPVPAGSASGADLVSSVLELPYREARSALLEAFEGQYLKALLTRTDGNVSQASRDAGMDRSHLTALIKRHGLR